MPDKIILSIETATLAGSVCISSGANIIQSAEGDSRISHSNVLLADIHRLLQRASVSLREIEVFAVASGPGSFTGLRIGLATVKAFAATLNKPCIGVPTLAAIAHSGGRSSCTLSLLPAGRGELFAQSFSVNEASEVNELDLAVHIAPVQTLERYKSAPDLLLAGTGAHLHAEVIKSFAVAHGIILAGNEAASGWRWAKAKTNLAEDVARMAYRRSSSKLQSPESLRAIYVRPSDAEIKTAAPEK